MMLDVLYHLGCTVHVDKSDMILAKSKRCPIRDWGSRIMSIIYEKYLQYGHCVKKSAWDENAEKALRSDCSGPRPEPAR
jgi:hypothetical protein